MSGMYQHTLDNLNQVTGVVHHTESFGAVDGPGLRFVFFLQGCPLWCLYCHNPDAIPRKGGEVWTARQAAREALRYRGFIREGGVTFSGGEPLLQARFVTAVSRLLHREGIQVAIDPAGSEDPGAAQVREAIDEADLLLLDIKAIDRDTCIRLTGRDHANTFKTLDYCENSGKPVWIRHVLLKEYTLDDVQLQLLAEKLKHYRCIRLVELLPFHKLGEPKWEALGWRYKLRDTPATNQDELEQAKRIFRENGFIVQ